MQLIKYSVGFFLVAACAEKAPAPSDTQKTGAAPTTVSTSNAPGSDSLRGIISVRGRDSLPDLVVETSADTVVLRGADIETLRRVIGFDVVVRGTRMGASFNVSSFIVRALDGQRVTDGTLDVDHGVFFVRTADGERANISTIPAPLRGEIGSRVYLVGPLDRGLSAFGVITEGR
jgi:hypothetical protein